MRLETHYGKAEVSTYRTRATPLTGTPVIPESAFAGVRTTSWPPRSMYR